MQRLVIVGASGHGREFLDVVEAINASEPTYEFLGYLDDGRQGDDLVRGRGYGIMGTSEILRTHAVTYVIGVGSAEARRRIDSRALGYGREAAVLVHPAATLGSEIDLAPGCVITAGARLTTNIALGRHVHVNINSSVSHDCRLGDYVTLNPGSRLAGNVILEDGVTIGIGASVVQGVRVGEDAVIGAGAVVVADIPAGVTAVGVPARPLRRDSVHSNG